MTSAPRPSPLVGALAGLLLSGCALQPAAGDRLFAAGEFAAARSAYEKVLATGPTAGRRHERALFHLGLIHARPTGEHYDPDLARRYLERLLAVDPPSLFATQAALILELQMTTGRLRAEMADQKDLARLLLDELRRSRAEAESLESEASGEQERALLLARRIQELQATMENLATELAAREEELERLKRIDWEDPP